MCTKEFKLPSQYAGGKDRPIMKPGMSICVPITAIYTSKRYHVFFKVLLVCEIIIFGWKSLSKCNDF